MKIDPLNVDVVYVAGLRSYYSGDLDESLKHFAKALSSDREYNKAKIVQLTAKHLKETTEMANDAIKAGNYRRAHDIYTEALQIDPKNINFNAKLYSFRAECHNHMENYEQCIKDYETALNMDKTTYGEIAKAFNETKITWKRYEIFKICVCHLK